MEYVIAAEQVGRRYGSNLALTECTLHLPAGKVVGLVGPNGAGKTTLLHMAVGLLEPTTGSIRPLEPIPVRSHPSSPASAL